VTNRKIECVIVDRVTRFACCSSRCEKESYMPPEGVFHDRRSRAGAERMPLLNAPRDAPSKARMIDLYPRANEDAVVNAVDDLDACDREIIASVGSANAAHHVLGIITLRMSREGDEAQCARSSDTPDQHRYAARVISSRSSGSTIEHWTPVEW
jgi:hypothetical protein